MIEFNLYSKIIKSIIYEPKNIKNFVEGKFTLGFCPVCEKKSLFYKKEELLRNYYKCIYCNSSARQRALLKILNTFFSDWRNRLIYEASPSGALSEKFGKECKNYIFSHYYSEKNSRLSNGSRCENLEKTTFPQESFDLIITQDVLEHIFNVTNAFKEIERILKPGGAHVFTVPYCSSQKTVIRAEQYIEGVKYLKEPLFHENPIDKEGSLVVREWGNDMADIIYQNSGMKTQNFNCRSKEMGLDTEFLDVFISKKQ